MMAHDGWSDTKSNPGISSSKTTKDAASDFDCEALAEGRVQSLRYSKNDHIWNNYKHAKLIQPSAKRSLKEM